MTVAAAMIVRRKRIVTQTPAVPRYFPPLGIRIEAARRPGQRTARSAWKGQGLAIGVPRSSSPAVSVTTLTFATGVDTVKPLGGRTPEVHRRWVSPWLPVYLPTPDQPHPRRTT